LKDTERVKFTFSVASQKSFLGVRIDPALDKLVSMITNTEQINRTDIVEEALWGLMEKRGFDIRGMKESRSKKEISIIGKKKYQTPNKEGGKNTR
jgi:hypothetical protein